MSSVWRWAVASNERAVANARAAATECSRARVERAEVEQFLSELGRVHGRRDREGGDAQAVSLSPVTDTPAGAARTVVVAEDEVLIRMDLAEMLTEEGYDVVGQAGDGATAVDLAERLRPDLVILDVKMPVLDGIAAAEQIASQRIAPVVILTAFSQRELVERARDAGAMAYLVKPFTQARPGARDRDGGQPVR